MEPTVVIVVLIILFLAIVLLVWWTLRGIRPSKSSIPDHSSPSSGKPPTYGPNRREDDNPSYWA